MVHDIRTRQIYEFIADLDFRTGDTLQLRSGGDGDNGEHLMNLLDAYFMNEDELHAWRSQDDG